MLPVFFAGTDIRTSALHLRTSDTVLISGQIGFVVAFVEHQGCAHSTRRQSRGVEGHDGFTIPHAKASHTHDSLRSRLGKAGLFDLFARSARARVGPDRTAPRGIAEVLAILPAGTIMAMKTCPGAHEWARMCLRHGLQPCDGRSVREALSQKARPPRTTAMMPRRLPPRLAKATCGSFWSRPKRSRHG